ncbi:MAG: HU family DNA-binding protein [Legionellaceae bacterium]|nr:HU family DNA-binding protein [Legionellaceae bacterium]
MSALTKADIVESLVESFVESNQFTKEQAKEVVEVFFDLLREILSRGEPVHFSGFGNFVLRDKEERPGLNPKTLDRVSVGARRVVTFKSGLKLKSKMQE